MKTIALNIIENLKPVYNFSALKQFIYTKEGCNNVIFIKDKKVAKAAKELLVNEGFWSAILPEGGLCFGKNNHQFIFVEGEFCCCELNKEYSVFFKEELTEFKKEENNNGEEDGDLSYGVIVAAIP